MKGRVQGVGFRAYTQGVAREAGIRGAVWNTRQGDVEIVADHDDESVLDLFVESIRRGPGYVSEIQKSRFEIDNLEPGFRIERTI